MKRPGAARRPGLSRVRDQPASGDTSARVAGPGFDLREVLAGGESQGLRSRERGGRYFGMPVVQRLTTPIERLATSSRVRGGRRQYQTGPILDAMIRRVPDDAYCMIAVTMVDLYPGPDWNFVFGQARLYQRVGVYSFARYDPAFYGEAHDASTPRRIPLRSLKLMAHEVGHMFGAEHCIHYTCVMNGTNNLEETDRSPLHLCPVCLRKLHDSIGFDVAERERRLAEFYRAHGLVDEAEVAERRLARLVAAGG